MYAIRRIDPWVNDEEREQLIFLYNTTREGWPDIDMDEGAWWFAELNGTPVAYIGMIPSDRYPDTGYFKRVGVLSKYRGHALQRRLMRVMETHAKKIGYTRIVSDTTDTIHSANNFIRAGYRLFEPATPWAFENTLYWTKSLT